MSRKTHNEAASQINAKTNQLDEREPLTKHWVKLLVVIKLMNKVIQVFTESQNGATKLARLIS